ncbi:MAG: PAS domain S-box protein [Methanoregula sp.]|nr:PAS domain S-box protein [Methanoregula sp.]
MINVYPLDISVLVNLLFSVGIVTISIWGYRKIGKSTPLYFGCAYTFFALSHFLLLVGFRDSAGIFFVGLRTAGYAFVAIGLFAILKDIICLQETERALRDSKNRLSATFDQAAVGIAEILPSFQVARVNVRFCDILGYSPSEIQSVPLKNLIAAEDMATTIDSLQKVFHGKLPGYSAETRCTRKDGTRAWGGLFISPVRDATGMPGYCILVLEDISARKEAEAKIVRLNDSLEERVLERTTELARANDALVQEICQRTIVEERLIQSLHEKEVLIKEIHHRVKNNLQIIVSLLYLQAQKIRDPACVSGLMDSQTRIRSMALIHEKLYQSGDLASIDFDGYLRNLAGNLMIAYGVDRSGIHVKTDAKDLALTINTAIPLGLIANELISNALKYAFTKKNTGEISLTGKKSGDRITLVVRDDGAGIPETFDWEHTDSLGFNLVRMLARQLRGTVTLDRSSGTSFTITLPCKE